MSIFPSFWFILIKIYVPERYILFQTLFLGITNDEAIANIFQKRIIVNILISFH